MSSSFIYIRRAYDLTTTSMKAMLLGMQIQIHIRHQSHFLYVNAENEYSCLPLEAYNESDIWSMHNHLIFIPFVIFLMFHEVIPVSCSSLFLDARANKTSFDRNTRIRNNDGWRRMMDPRLLRSLKTSPFHQTKSS